MKILVTGANGFIGKNLITRLKELGSYTIFSYDLDSSFEDLDGFTKECDFVFHLAGVNRPKEEKEYIDGDFGFTSTLLNLLKKHKTTAPIIFSSSVQASLNNPYGVSKKASEDLLFKYGKETGARVIVYRFENVFGKWARPNYNSVVATFSYNIARNLPITVNDPVLNLNLIYIDDVINELINALNGQANMRNKYAQVEPVYNIKLSYITELLYSFKESRTNLSVPKLDNPFVKKLYSTYLSYLPQNDFIYNLKMNIDNRGSFTEFIKTLDRGQVSVNISKPSTKAGNHYHHTKTEKFLVVSGTGIIRFRQIASNKIIEYFVSGDKLQVLDIPPGYTHNIQNIGETDMVTIIWANEPFDKDNPDTIYEEV